MYELLDFEELQKLAKEDPDQLERLRIQMCEKIIADAPSSYRRKLRGLQFRIDMERRKAKSPMAACISLSGMMHDAFDSLRFALNDASGANGHRALFDEISEPETFEAKVLPFRRA